MKKLLLAASILGMLGVIIGAMGAHALKPLLNQDQLSWIQKGVQYQFIHLIMIFICVILSKIYQQTIFLKAGWLFMTGIILFSGSLYLLATRDLIGLTYWKWLGPITPLGGLSFIAGWLLMIYGNLKSK